MSTQKTNDSEMAKRIATVLKDVVIFHGGTWYEKKSNGIFEERTVSRMLNLLSEVVAAKWPGEKTARWRNVTGLKAVLTLLESLLAYDDEVNPPGYIGTKEGVYDCKAGRIVDNADVILTQELRLVPDFDYGEVKKVIEGWVGEEVASWLQAACGYFLTGTGREQIILVNHGTGANGKSLFWGGVVDAAKPYSTPMDKASLTSNARQLGSGHRADLARLEGKRIVTVAEADADGFLSASTLKALVGGKDQIIARMPFASQPKVFYPQFTPILFANRLPSFNGQDGALWRRIRIINWPNVYPQNPAFAEWWDQQCEKLLGWLLDGVRMYFENGLPDLPEAVKEETNGWREECDAIGRYLRGTWVADPDGRVKAGEIYDDYLRWCSEEGEYAKSTKAMAQALLNTLGAERVRTETGSCWRVRRIN